MEALRLKSNYLASQVPTEFSREIFNQIDWEQRLIGILGARGLGKTTILLQQLSKQHGFSSQAIYISMDDISLSGASLHELATEFRSKGCTYIYIDEVQKHPTWSQELKIIYDTLPDLNVVFAGACTIDILKHYASLSKAATIYNLQGLSFREYLAFKGVAKISLHNFESLIENHHSIALGLVEDFKPLLHFNKYLTMGYYPISTNNYEEYKREVEKHQQFTIELDMATMDGYDPRNSLKIKRLLNIISQNVPFKPNLVAISERIGVHRNTLIGYLFLLEKAKLISLLYPSGSTISILQKPEVVYLDNTSASMVLCPNTPSRNTLIETYAINSLKMNHELKIAKQGLIDVDGKWMLSIEGSKRKRLRRKAISSTILNLADGIEIGSKDRIPLWMIGLSH